MSSAFLFPGQGAQVVGMGKDVAEAFPAAAAVFRKADDIVGFDLSGICFEGPSEKLNRTAICQPAIFVTSAAILEVLRTSGGAEQGVADVMAGLSLGEYTALYGAGLIDFEEALLLVKKRGEAMQAAADEQEGSMVSIIGLDEEKVAEVCSQACGGELLRASNFNCPGQIVISGAKAACDRAEAVAVEHGAIKAVRLEVAGAFHTEMMASAAAALEEALSGCEIREPGEVQVIANIDAEYYQSAEKIAKGLTKQLTQAILWQKCMERLIADGVEKFYEIGPGRVLTGLMRRINRKIRVVNISNVEALTAIVGM
jgi:[acyl-carrier-protein] S-malonyltransferase